MKLMGWVTIGLMAVSTAFAAKVQLEKILGSELKLEGDKKTLLEIHQYLQDNKSIVEKDADKKLAATKLLDSMKTKFNTGWVGNIGAATFISDRKYMTALPYVSDTMADSMPYAIVDLKSGWMVSASNAEPEVNRNCQKKKISSTNTSSGSLFFASPSFSGPKLEGPIQSSQMECPN